MNDAQLPVQPLAHALNRVSQIFAIGGGLVLTGLTVISVLSIASRTLTGRSLPGDFELVELGCGVAVFAFLPYCHLRGGNVIVDFFTLKAGARVKRALDAAGGVIYLAIAVLLAWRMYLGGLDKLNSHETTMILGVPIWLAFVPIGLSLLLLIAVVAHVTWRDIAALARRGAS